jgi:DDE_Tnp_1-associated
MEPLITIFREVRDPRDLNARHDLAAMLFTSLAATLCGAKSCVEIADFAAANEDFLSGVVDLPHGVPSHDTFSRVFRLLDPEEMAGVFARFRDALRAALGLEARPGASWRWTARASGAPMSAGAPSCPRSWSASVTPRPACR